MIPPSLLLRYVYLVSIIRYIEIESKGKNSLFLAETLGAFFLLTQDSRLSDKSSQNIRWDHGEKSSITPSYTQLKLKIY